MADAGDMSYWDWRALPENDSFFWQVGILKVWLRRVRDEWHLAHDRDPLATEDTLVICRREEPPGGVTWKRWVMADAQRQIRLLPILPDRPLVIRPETPMAISVGQSCLLYAGLILWLRVELGPEKPVTLTELPTKILSNTWFGEPTAGELCYSLRISARRHLENLPPRPQRARCAVTLRNQADCPLELSRFCLRVGHCRVFHGRGMLWASSVTMLYRGGTGVDMRADISIGDPPPSAAPVKELSAPRDPVPDSLLERLLNLRSFSL